MAAGQRGGGWRTTPRWPIWSSQPVAPSGHPPSPTWTRTPSRGAQALGLQVIPWTVNSPADLDRLIGWGVDGIITDYPDRGRAGDAPARAGAAQGAEELKIERFLAHPVAEVFGRSINRSALRQAGGSRSARPPAGSNRRFR
ncbi:MAG: hypothetical protein IPL15_17895 [Comamonadaceae bacterium]|uniref:glycerophosphodiester phosphodiesterase family protein n=1 Tax=Candidatus Skiveiella danica TaxID=3386177 RepID=UPI00390B48A4|nr:hypothetical protein [Comamonadaceae bacterium]